MRGDVARGEGRAHQVDDVSRPAAGDAARAPAAQVEQRHLIRELRFEGRRQLRRATSPALAGRASRARGVCVCVRGTRMYDGAAPPTCE